MTMTIMVTMMKGALGDCHPKVSFWHDDNHDVNYDENAMTMTIMVTMMKGALGDCHPKVMLS